jgi:hypothetical protein
VTNPKEIQNIVNKIKSRRDTWVLSTRSKNLRTLSALGMDSDVLFDDIYHQLSWRNYNSGPLMDDHTPPIPGDIWVFGLKISDLDCYLKFQDKPNGVIFWISIHEQEYSMNLPFE